MADDQQMTSPTAATLAAASDCLLCFLPVPAGLASAGMLFSLLLSTAVWAGAPPPGLIPDGWLACDSNADCIDVYVGCFEAAVNNSFFDQVAEYFRAASARLDCEPVTRPTRTPVCHGDPTASQQCHLIGVIK
jgi:hypothetical protein